MTQPLNTTSTAGASNPLAHEPPPPLLSEGSQQAKEALKDVAFGSIAGIAGKFIEYPFDTVKVRLQSQPHTRPLLYNGPLDCFRQSIRRDGFWSLYRGISAPLVGAAVETSSLFFSYRLAQDILKSTILPPEQPLSMPALLLCGSVSGAFTSLLLTPIELIKCKMQVSPTNFHNPHNTTSATATPLQQNPLTLIAKIYRQEGILSFWHGQLGTLIRETGGSAAWFGSYEAMKLGFYKLRASSPRSSSGQQDRDDQQQQSQPEQEPPLPFYQQLLSGAVAGMSYNFIFYPADTIKSCMQTEELVGGGGGAHHQLAPSSSSNGNQKEYMNRKRTFWAVSRALWRQSGVAGLYRGCGITVFRAAPSSAFIFAIYEALRRRFE